MSTQSYTINVQKGDAIDPAHIPLPVLRGDLSIFPGPPSLDGSPTFTIYDPLSRTYDQIDWAGAEILYRLRKPKTIAKLLQEIEQDTTLRATPDEIIAFCKNAQERGLTMDRLTRPVDSLLEERSKRKIHPLKWLLHNYLYFRVPLIRPDAFLDKTLWIVKGLANRGVMFLYAFLLVWGLTKVISEPDAFFGTFSYFFNWQGMALFGLAIVGTKIIHEFSHAYVAKSYGCRVPVMGVAFMVLWPVAYSDVTDAWRLQSRKRRLAISGAGVMAELAMAGLSLFMWGVAPEGIFKSICFVICSSSLISTLLINVNPGMRYDGYYLLMDILGVDNLQFRAFAVTRWFYRRLFLGIRKPCPEPEASKKRLALMIFYSIYAWLYRITLYIAIAVLVYYKFTKALGIVLFVIEVWFFISRPFYLEAKAIYRQRGSIHFNLNLLLTLCGLSLLLLWLALPLPRRFSLPAVLVPRASQSVYVPHSGQVVAVNTTRGAPVERGKTLLVLDSIELRNEKRITELELEKLKAKQELYAVSTDEKAFIAQVAEEQSAVEAQLSSLEKQIDQMRLVAEIDGSSYIWDQTVVQGRYLAKNDMLGKVGQVSQMELFAFVSEDDVAQVQVGDKGMFMAKADPHPIGVTVLKVNPVRSETINYLSLTSLAKGVLPVTESQGKMYMLESRYQVELLLDDVPQGYKLGQTGKVWLESGPRSRVMMFLRYVYSVILREISF